MSKKNRRVELDITCVKCGYKFSLSINKDSEEDIKVCCPNCSYRNRKLERNLREALLTHISKTDELLFIVKSMFITRPMQTLEIIKLKTALAMIEFGKLIKSKF